MLNLKENILLVLIAGAFLMGILGNGFIMFVNCIEWVKSKKISAVDFILISLATSRIILLCTIIWNSFRLAFWTDGSAIYKVTIADILWILSHYSGVWFTACLSIFYLFKISSFSHSLFLWLKWRINKVSSFLLVGTLVISWFTGFVLLQRANSHYMDFIKESERNISQEVHVSRNKNIILQVLLSFQGLIPFTLSTFSCFLLLLSLWRHTQQMKLNVTGSSDPSTEAHVKVMKMMVSFLILLGLYYLGYFLTTKSLSLSESKVSLLFGVAIMSLYPSSHSLILILSNSKLRKVTMSVLGPMKCFLK